MKPSSRPTRRAISKGTPFTGSIPHPSSRHGQRCDPVGRLRAGRRAAIAGSICQGLALWRLRQSANLRQRREPISDAPVLDDLAILEAALIQNRDGDRLAGRRDAGEGPPLRAADT